MNFQEWKERPIEARTLFNPMFCALVLEGAVASFNKEASRGIPLSLMFLVLPLVLHSKTRSSLPKMKTSNLGLWCKEHENELLMLAKRVSSLNKTTLQALSLLKLNEHVSIVDKRVESQSKLKGVNPYLNLSDEIKDIHAKSQFVGRWLANSGDVTTIFTYLGVRP
jgi:hypothetical protein